MYLARKRIRGRTYYFIRESYRDGNRFLSRELCELGTNPADHIVYPGGNAFYISEDIVDLLISFGMKQFYSDLEDIFWRFVHPDIKRAVGSFRSRKFKKTPMDRGKQDGKNSEFHLFDKRRVHFLRYGQMDQGRIGQVSPRLFKRLAEKSRDEIEQYMIDSESILRGRELKAYVFTIFDLQRFFSEATAKLMPQALCQEKVDAYFIQEICRLNEDERFWSGMGGRKEDRLHDYLVRYLIMFFDSDYGRSAYWDEYLYNFINSRRYFRRPEKGKPVNIDEAAELFGVGKEALQKMTRKGLARVYRKVALHIHPDQGGDHDTFIRLTETYQALLRTKK